MWVFGTPRGKLKGTQPKAHHTHLCILFSGLNSAESGRFGEISRRIGQLVFKRIGSPKMVGVLLFCPAELFTSLPRQGDKVTFATQRTHGHSRALSRFRFAALQEPKPMDSVGSPPNTKIGGNKSEVRVGPEEASQCWCRTGCCSSLAQV